MRHLASKHLGVGGMTGRLGNSIWSNLWSVNLEHNNSSYTIPTHPNPTKTHCWISRDLEKKCGGRSVFAILGELRCFRCFVTGRKPWSWRGLGCAQSLVSVATQLQVQCSTLPNQALIWVHRRPKRSSDSNLRWLECQLTCWDQSCYLLNFSGSCMMLKGVNEKNRVDDYRIPAKHQLIMVNCNIPVIRFSSFLMAAEPTIPFRNSRPYLGPIIRFVGVDSHSAIWEIFLTSQRFGQGGQTLAKWWCFLYGFFVLVQRLSPGCHPVFTSSHPDNRHSNWVLVQWVRSSSGSWHSNTGKFGVRWLGSRILPTLILGERIQVYPVIRLFKGLITYNLSYTYSSTWRIIPGLGSVVRITPSISHEVRPFGRGPTTRVRGLTITMVIDHLLTAMILQVAFMSGILLWCKAQQIF